MALPDRLKYVPGTPLVFSNSGEYSPGSGRPTGTDADIDLQSLGTTPDFRQSVKLDLGSANLDVLWTMNAAIEWFTAPTAGAAVNFYLSWSSSATAGNDNMGGCNGTDAIYNGYGAAAADAAEAVKQLDFIGSLICTADIAIQVGHVGNFYPKQRYCILVVENATSVALAVTDAIETAAWITPLELQVQD